MRKLWLAVIILLLSVSAQANDWPSGKAYGYHCVKTLSCNVIIDNLTEQPTLFIGKNTWNGSNAAINIAYKGNHTPTTMTGVWGDGWVGKKLILPDCEMGTCNKLEWSDWFDSMIFAPGVGGGEVVLSEKAIELGYPVDGGHRVSSFRHSYDISHLLQHNNLETLKQGLIKGAEGNWLKELQADPFLYGHGNLLDYQGFANSLNWFYPTIIPLIEAHIVLQRNNIYTPDEFNLVHNWLEKRVWVLEQGPMDGTLPSNRNWQLTHEASNHETIKKNVAYMLWGIADNNRTYFTAGVNGFKEFYKSMRRNGTFKAEHKKGDGGNYGLSSGNEVGQAMVMMAIILHNQGIDVRKKYPKIEKFVQWASENYNDPKKTGLTVNGTYGNTNVRFMTSDAMPQNTLGWMFLWDNVFKTNYSEDYTDKRLDTKALVTFGISFPEDIIIN